MNIGTSGSLGFPRIRSGSVTAYLPVEREYPFVIWFSAMNCIVVVALTFTFPHFSAAGSCDGGVGCMVGWYQRDPNVENDTVGGLLSIAFDEFEKTQNGSDVS
jgi:hypothetical protein